jgi:SAM-dependent methyltransferase
VNTGVHRAAAEGYGAAADAYRRSRPGYPDRLVTWLADELRIGPDTDVLDLAAGTGALTRGLVPTGARVMAVEPVARMRQILAAELPGVPALDGTAEQVPLPDGAMDVVTVAQAFHWFDGAAAAREIHRVLRPGGRLGVLFNVRDESAPWNRRLTRMLAPLEGDAPRHRHGRWRAALDTGEWFVRPRELSVRFDWPVTRAGFLDRVRSISFVASAPEEARAGLLSEIEAMLDTDPDLAGRGVIPFAYRAEALVLDRR